MILLAIQAQGLTGITHGPALNDRCWAEYAWPDCNDGNLFNGYWWRGEGFVPGMLTQEAHFSPAPIHTRGMAVYYAAGVMEGTARYMGFDLDKYLDGVAMMSCSDIGQVVWIRRENETWEGPFLVVDCAEWDDHYPVAVFRNEVVEVGYRTASRWGIIDEWKTRVEVYKSRYRPIDDVGEPINFGEWFLGHVQFYSQARTELPGRAIFHYGGARWRINNKWYYFLPWHREMLTEKWSGWGWGPSFYAEPWIREVVNR